MCPKKLDTFNSTEKKPGSWKHYAEFYRHANYRRENFQTYFDQVAGSADKYRAIFEDNYCPFEQESRQPEWQQFLTDTVADIKRRTLPPSMTWEDLRDAIDKMDETQRRAKAWVFLGLDESGIKVQEIGSIEGLDHDWPWLVPTKEPYRPGFS